MRAPGWRAALAVSTGAHAALLGALLLGVRPAPPPRPLSVHLWTVPREERGPFPGAASTSASPARPAELPARRPAARSPRAEGRTVPTPGPLGPLFASASLLAAAPAPASPDGAGTDGAAGALPGPGPVAGGASVPEASRLEELHRRLALAAARCYPAAARRFRLQGEVPVHFCLDATGAATALSLEGSTGSPLLDRSALECVVPGAQPLSGFEGCFLVPVHFGG